MRSCLLHFCDASHVRHQPCRHVEDNQSWSLNRGWGFTSNCLNIRPKNLVCLLHLFAFHVQHEQQIITGCDWKRIAKIIVDRTDKAVQSRWHSKAFKTRMQEQNRSVPLNTCKLWSREEDSLLTVPTKLRHCHEWAFERCAKWHGWSSRLHVGEGSRERKNPCGFWRQQKLRRIRLSRIATRIPQPLALMPPPLSPSTAIVVGTKTGSHSHKCHCINGIVDQSRWNSWVRSCFQVK